MTMYYTELQHLGLREASLICWLSLWWHLVLDLIPLAFRLVTGICHYLLEFLAEEKLLLGC